MLAIRLALDFETGLQYLLQSCILMLCGWRDLAEIRMPVGR